MRKLPKPSHDSSTVFRDCSSRTRLPLRTKLRSIQEDIASAAEIYNREAQSMNLYLIDAQEALGEVTAGEMALLYNIHFAREGSIGRPTYNAIISAPKHQRCPLCGQGVVSTLDHYLPKSIYPQFAVAPINLIPACRDCNTRKGTKVETNPRHQLIHPYYDDFEDGRWLFANLNEGVPVGISFHCVPPAIWSETKRERAKYHFHSLNLSALFASNAATEIVGIRERLVQLHLKGGHSAVEAHLEEEFRSRQAVFANSWEAAAYDAMASNHWFCRGGFKNL